MYSLDIYGTFYFVKVTLAVQYNAKALGSQRDLTVHLYSHNDNNEKQAAVTWRTRSFATDGAASIEPQSQYNEVMGYYVITEDNVAE